MNKHFYLVTYEVHTIVMTATVCIQSAGNLCFNVNK